MAPSTESIDDSGLSLTWADAPWDSVVTGYPVWQITQLRLGPGKPDFVMGDFAAARDQAGVGLVSCRLRIDQLPESMFLERYDFRFIETVFSPQFDLLPTRIGKTDHGLTVRIANLSDMPFVLATAESAFSHERFHVDPRLGSAMGNLRYRNWASSSFDHPRQKLFVLSDETKPVTFFVTEMQEDGTCYWHLNAVAPEHQGQGYGLRCWRTMIQFAARNGAKRIRTTVVARNTRVLNLYARLGFRILDPHMTFHWVRET